MEKLMALESLIWLGVMAAIIVVVVLVGRYIEGKLNPSGPTEANPNVDEQAAQQAVVDMVNPNATDEQQAAALKSFFDTAHDPNPQGFFARLWSVL